MWLPNADHAVVDMRKIIDYLLNPTHQEGGPKEAFFVRFGFRRELPQVLQRVLLEHGRKYQVTQVVDDPHGIKYSVEGEIECPDGRTPRIRTIWMIDIGADFPRLISAYPA